VPWIERDREISLIIDSDFASKNRLAQRTTSHPVPSFLPCQSGANAIVPVGIPFHVAALCSGYHVILQSEKRMSNVARLFIIENAYFISQSVNARSANSVHSSRTQKSDD
jgi:hypothetical protein